MTINNLGRKRFIWFIQSYDSIEGSQSKHSRQWHQGMKQKSGRNVLAGLCLKLVQHFSLSSQEHLVQGWTTHSDLVSPTSVINLENAPEAFLDTNQLKLPPPK